MFDIVGVFLQISKHAGSQKNPKVLAESLNWLSDAIKGFGFKYKSMIFLFSFLNELLVLNRNKKSSSPHCTLKHCTKIAFKRESTCLRFLFCPLCLVILLARYAI